MVSEWVKPRANANVGAWLAETNEDDVFLSVITFAEIRHGVEAMPSGPRRSSLERWLEYDLPMRFEGRVLGVDMAVAIAWGVVMARAGRAGSKLSAMDAFLAATAEALGLTLVTRNTRDFEGLGIPLLNPWERGHA